jgi:alkylated DNA repair dioxygenase AlkB
MTEKHSQLADFDSPTVQHLAMPDGEVALYPLTFPEHNSLFQTLLATTLWQQHVLTFYGRPTAAPRLSAWYGDTGAIYSYSGLRLEPLPWNKILLKIKHCVDDLAGVCFNSVLMNLYRDGQDSMGWHSDAEPELGRNPVIASVSLGAVRRFNFQHKKRPIRLSLDLAAGSTLLMKGSTQHYWRHSLPKTRKAVGARINLTFRRIVSPSKVTIKTLEKSSYQ